MTGGRAVLQEDKSMHRPSFVIASILALLALSPAFGSGSEIQDPAHADGLLLTQAAPSNPGISPGSGAAGPPPSGGGISNPGVPPSGSTDQMRMQEDIRQQQRLRENSLARKQAAQMQRQSEMKYRYYLERDPLESREAAREALRWKEQKDRLDKQRERLLQSE